LSKPETAPIRPFQQRKDEPIFDEPWQAQVLAIADALSGAGAFSATEWSRVLGDEIRHAEESKAPDSAAIYYQAALNALERLLIGADITTPDAIADRQAAWARAYLATPHGQPVKLENGQSGESHHDHH
jgi:nitrile hydratase accessory protein